MPLLEVSELKVHFPVRRWFGRTKQFVRAVDGVSFTIEPGEIVGLVGESGCGKSTLGRALVRLENPTAGSVKLDGVELTTLKGANLRAYRKNFQMIFQDPYGSLNPRLTVYETLDEVLKLHCKLDKAWRLKRIESLVEQVGIDPIYLDRYPHQFSGGQRQRIGIARALAIQPKLIVADEPVSALDVSVQAQIINLLAQLRQQTNTAFLFIAHDLAVVEHISDRILVMYLGRLVESGPAAEVCRRPRHPYTKALLSAVPTIERTGQKARLLLPGDVPSPIAEIPGCPFHPRCPLATERCRTEVPTLQPTAQSDHLSSCFLADQIGMTDN